MLKKFARPLLTWLPLGLLAAAPAMAAEGLAGRMILGYQGWFGCPGDFAGNKRWMHWAIQGKDTIPLGPDNIRVELLPALQGIPEADLCKTDLRTADGSPIFVFSQQNPHVVAAHMKMLAEHGVDGVAIQRFIAIIDNRPDNPQGKERSDHMIENVRAAAEASGRVFFITYDVSGSPDTVIADLRRDWQHLVNDLKITDSPAYLHLHGKPLLQLWGFGFKDHPGSADDVAQLMADLKAGHAGLGAAALIGGVPTGWRTLSDDSQPDARWGQIYRSYDVVSPWMVGRMHDDQTADGFLRSHVVPDLAETKRLGLGYMPVVFPGFSWSNLQARRGNDKIAVFNQIPRRCGNFLWHQVSGLLGAGVNMLYGAMFDEIDEGTAMLPAVTRADHLPAGIRMLDLNHDGCSLAPDWYLKVAGAAANHLHRGQPPPRQLDAVIKP